MADVVFQIETPEGKAVGDAAVLAAHPNDLYRTGQTDSEGKCHLGLYRTDQEMTVLVAAEGYLPLHTTVPPEKLQAVHLELKPSTKGWKGVLFTQDIGYIPGISGRLNPHPDGYVYGDNIAINGQLAHPAVRFKLEEDLHLLDVYGVETTIRFLVVKGQFSLIEYTEPMVYGGE